MVFLHDFSTFALLNHGFHMICRAVSALFARWFLLDLNGGFCMNQIMGSSRYNDRQSMKFSCCPKTCFLLHFCGELASFFHIFA